MQFPGCKYALNYVCHWDPPLYHTGGAYDAPLTP